MILLTVTVRCGSRKCDASAPAVIEQTRVTDHHEVAAHQELRLPPGWWLNDWVDGDPLRCPKHGKKRRTLR